MHFGTQAECQAIPESQISTPIRISGFLSGIVLRYSVVFFLVAFGLQKWTTAEAQGIEPFMRHSPFFSWVYSIFAVQQASEFIGVIELILAVLIAVATPFPKLSTVGSAGAVIMFLLTLSFLITTPGLGPSDQGFCSKI